MTLKVNFLGQLEFAYNKKSIDHLLPNKAKGLFSYLIMNYDKVILRDHICDLFWQNSPRDASRYNLRYNLWLIRKALKSIDCHYNYLVNPSKETCRFNSKGLYNIDVFKFRELVKASKDKSLTIKEKVARLEEASSLYKSNFL